MQTRSFNVTISRELIARLRHASLEMSFFANMVGVAPCTLSQWLHGRIRVRPGDDRVIRIGRVLGLKPEECFDEYLAISGPCCADSQPAAEVAEAAV